MKHRHNTLSRVVSLLLIVAMLMTTPAFSIFAEEATANAEINAADAASALKNEENAADEETEVTNSALESAEANVTADGSDEMTPELMDLLLRSQEYDTFTDEEKRMFQAFFHMAPDEEELQEAYADQQRIKDEIASMPEKQRYENAVLELQRKNKLFSDLNEEEQSLVLEYSAFPNHIKEAFLYFEQQGLDLHESALAAEIMVGELFNAEESLTIFKLYSDRVEREKNVLGFKDFAKAFLDEKSVDVSALYSADPLTAYRAKLRVQKAEYINHDALQKAKEMLLNGYSAQEIRAAYQIAATYNLVPEDCLVDHTKAQSNLSKEEQLFFAAYPASIEIVKELCSTGARSDVIAVPGDLTSSTKTQVDDVKSDSSISQVMHEVTSVGVALYSTFDEIDDDPIIESVQQPIDVKIDNHENIRINTGALEYHDTIAALPGVNGGTFDLQLQYGSDESALEKYDYKRSSQTRYAIVGTQVEMAEGRLFEDTERQVIHKGYTSAEAAAEALSEMQESETPCKLTNPFVASKTATKTIRNVCEKSWWTNPYELLYDKQSNPAPSSYTYSSGGYHGVLPRTKTEKESDNGTVVKATNGDRVCYYQKTVWVATFEGTVRKNVTDGYLVYVSAYIAEYTYSTASNRTAEQTYNESRYDLGSGWSLSIPSINRDAHGESLILPGIGTYALSGNTIKDYKRSDMKLTSDKSYNNGQFSSTQKLTFADGTVYYFSSDGLLLAMVDRFGTTVTFKYAQVNGNYHPSEIIDADGHSTTITYATTDAGSTITITAPDGSATTLHTKALDSETYGTDNSLLEKIVYPDGETVSFDYTMETGTYSFTGLSGGLSIQYALLNQVTYNTGAKLHYAYEMQDVKLGSGHLNTYRLTERYTTNGTDDMQRIDSAAYSYTGDYSRKTTYKTAVSEVKNGQTIRTEYTFNKDHLCTLQEIQVDGTMMQKVETTYDSYELPNKVVQTMCGTDVLSATELYTHDKYGNTLTYFSPKANGNANDTDYRTTYTYDSMYNLPLTVEYKQDAATTIKIVNTLTEDKKGIVETATYVNNTLTALTTYTYNARGQVTSKTNCLDLAAKTGVTTAYTYNGANLATETITGLTDADGNALPDLVTAYTYDTMGRLLTATDAAGRTTTNTYDVRGRLLTTTAPDGSVTAYTYDLTANDTTVSQPGREDIVVDFDSIGQKQAVYYPSGDLQKEYYYDTAGRLVIEATGRGSSAANTVYYTYDPLDRLIEKRICDKDGVELYRETTAYDDALTETQALVTKTVLGEDGAPGTVVKTYINAYGETVREDVDGVVTDYAYDFVGNRTCTAYTENGRTVSAYGTYDFRGNVLTETNALGNTRTVTYDAIGRKIAESDFKGNATTYAYDAAGRLLISSAPLDGAARSVVKYTYDSAGNVTRQMQSAEAVGAETPVWRTVEYVYDDRNRVTDIAQTADETHKVWTHYAYNEAGDLTDIYTGLSMKWSLAVNPETYSHARYVYNNRGKATSLTDALGQTETYVYDALGYLIEATGRDGKVTRYTYTGLGKPLTEAIYASAAANAPAAETVYTCYKNGLTRSITADGSTVQYTYDTHGNVLTDRDETATRTYTYDSRGRKSGYTLTVGDTEISTATYAYDDLNRLVSVTESGVTTTYTYDANGNRASQTTGEVSVAYTYNDANLVTSLTNTLTNASGKAVVASAFAYTYYADGNQHTKAETMLGGDPVTTTYVYDGLGRLTAETKGEDSITYTYDNRGNRVGMTADGKATTYVYDANNRLVFETTGEAAIVYAYDANGNLLTTMTQVESAHSFEDGVCRRCEDWQTYRLGDLNLDGEISLADVLEILKLNSGSSSAQASMDLYSTASLETISAAGAADLNSNGVLDTEDYMLFLYNLLGDDLVSTSLYAAEGQTDDAADEWAAFADLDGNGIIEVADYSIALAIMSAPTPRLTDRMARMIADVNGDGVVNTADAVDLTNYLNNAGSSYPINTIVSNTTLCPIEKAYAYNEHGQQINFNTADVSAAYAYNPNGFRNIKTVGGSTKYFVYNGMNIVYEYSESVADGVAYYYGLNRTHNSEGEIYLYNAHGDVVQLVKDNAVIVSYTYDAFGNLTSQVGESDNPFLYCGEYYDAETQTYYLRARYYNPANGRFNAEDPVKDGFNWYAYCGNNPIMYVDPTGLIMEGDENLPDEIQILLNGINKDGKGGLSLAWTLASEEERETIADFAKKLRSFDVTSINRVMPLINSKGAFGAGHTATMIINEQDQALILSYYPSTMNIVTEGQMRIGVYDADKWNAILYSSNKVDLIGSNGTVEPESYTGSLYLTVSSENGRNALKTIANLYNNPGTYSLFFNNCDHQTSYIVSSAGLYYEKHLLPNDSFKYTSAFHSNRKMWYWYKFNDIVVHPQFIPG